MSAPVVALYFALLASIFAGLLLRPLGSSGRIRQPPLRTRLVASALLLALVAPAVLPALPPVMRGLPLPQLAAAAEIVNMPQYLGATVLPNGQVGLIYVNTAADGTVETRFKRYFAEQGLEQALRLSFTSERYPQLASFQGQVVAAYVDNEPTSPTRDQLRFRVSADSGASWAAEYSPFGTEPFAKGNETPLLVSSRDGLRLYVFSCCGAGNIPQYRFTTDASLATWSAAALAGDGTMRPVSGNNCGASGQECYRAHSFEFTENAAGQWLYIAKSDAGFGQSGRGTQVGTLGGAWTAQVDLGGSGGLTGCCGESRATAFLDRAGTVYYLRGDDKGQNLYRQKSSDGGLSWGPRIYAYASALPQYTTAAPVGLYVPGYSQGEYVWFAGFGGIGFGNDQNTARVIPLWGAPRSYEETGTARLFGSLGGDWDFGTAYPYVFGRRDVPTGIGAYKTSAEDLRLPGRLLSFVFSRSYNSADTATGPLGPAWQHSYNWSLRENGALVQLRRGDGRRDTFSRQGDGSYTAPPNVFDTLSKNADASFTLTLKNQTTYEFSSAGRLERIREPAGNQLTLSYLGGHLFSITDTVGRSLSLSYTGGHNAAFGQAYTKSLEPSPTYPDTANAELSDGLLGSATDFHDAAWVGHQNLPAPLDVSLDLGTARSVGLVRSFHYHEEGPGIFKPTSVEILTSTDNITYTSRGSIPSLAAVNDAGNRWRYELDLGGILARWVRFKISSGGTWTFSTETAVYLAGSAPLPAQAGTNLATARSYTSSVAPSPTYPDTGGSELTDGNRGNPTSYADASWQGHQNLGATPLDITVDLGSTQRLGVARSYHFEWQADGIYRPKAIEVLTSTDNVSFLSRAKTTAAAGSTTRAAAGATSSTSPVSRPAGCASRSQAAGPGSSHPRSKPSSRAPHPSRCPRPTASGSPASRTPSAAGSATATTRSAGSRAWWIRSATPRGRPRPCTSGTTATKTARPTSPRSSTPTAGSASPTPTTPRAGSVARRMGRATPPASPTARARPPSPTPAATPPRKSSTCAGG